MGRLRNYLASTTPDAAPSPQTGRLRQTLAQRPSVERPTAQGIVSELLAPIAPSALAASSAQIRGFAERAGETLFPGEAARPMVGPRLPPAIERRLPDWLLTLREFPQALGAEAVKQSLGLLTPEALALNAASLGGLRLLARTPLGQFPVETLAPVGSRLRAFLRSLGAPQVLEPITRPRPTPPPPVIVEAETVPTSAVPLALPPPAVPVRPSVPTPAPPQIPTIRRGVPALPAPRVAPSVTAPLVQVTRRPVVPSTLPSQARMQHLLRQLRQTGQEMTGLERQRQRLLRAGQSTGGVDQRLNALSQEFNVADGAMADLLVGNATELSKQLAATAIGELPLGALSRIESEAQQRLASVMAGMQARLNQLATKANQRISRVAAASERSGMIQAREHLVTQLEQQLRLSRPLLRAAQRAFLSPSQVSRFARLQRVEPSAQVLGPRGGRREAPLSASDIRRVSTMVGRIVPRRPVITGQPPRIPRTRRLVPATFAQHPFRDLTAFQAAPLSGLDPIRAARWVDGEAYGPVRREVIEPSLAAARAVRQEEREVFGRLERAAPRLRSKTEESTEVFDLAENVLPANRITPRLLQAAGEMRETYDALRNRLNVLRRAQGKTEIAYVNNYITHIQLLNLLDEFYGGLANIPDDAISLPTFTTHPNAPWFQFALKRMGGPHARDAVAAYQRYVRKALAVIHYTPVLQRTRPLLRFLPPRAQGYFHQQLDEVLALKRPAADLLFPRPLIAANNWLRRQTGGGAILGNIASVFNQLWSMPATVAAVGPSATVRAGGQLLRATGKDILNGIIRRVGPRAYSQSVLLFQQPDVRDFIRAHSTLLQDRQFEIDFDPRTMDTMDKALGHLITMVDQEMVSLAWLGGYLNRARAGASHAEAVRFAAEVAFGTQSGYTPEYLAPIFRSSIGKSLMQFGNSLNNVFNFLRFDVGLQPTRLLPRRLRVAGRVYESPFIRSLPPNHPFRQHVREHPDTLKQAMLFFGSVLALKTVYDHAGIPSAMEDAMDLVPLWGMAEFGPPAAWAGPFAVVSLMTADTPQERAKATHALKRAGFNLLGRGGNQLRKTWEGIEAISRGGKFSRDGRLLFPVTGSFEQLRSAAFGPYGTKAGRAYIRRGFVPEPRPQSEVELRRKIGALRSSLMR